MQHLPVGATAVLLACKETGLQATDATPRRPPLRLGPDADPADASEGRDGADAQDAGQEPDGEAGDAEAQDAQAADAEDASAEDASEVAVDPSTLPEAPLEHFPLGIAAGDCDRESAVLWTLYRGSSSVSVAVWPENQPAAARSFVATPADAGYTHALVSGLSGGRWYQYVFVELDRGRSIARSPVGRFRAALSDSALEPLVIAASACTSNARDRFRTLEQAGQRTDLDLFLLLGDTSYNDGAVDLDAYRDRWGENLAKDGYRGIRRATSLLATWDDHEVGNNWNPETIAPAQLEVARRVFFEHTPARRHPTDPGRIWRQARWGRTLEVFVLDSRGERRPSTRLDPTRCQYLSRAQMDWLKAGLSASDAVFKIIVSSVPIAMMPAAFDLGNVLLDPADRWTGYPAQRSELIQHIEGGGIGGVVFLSGDYHLAYTGHLDGAGSPGASILEVLGGPGNQVANPLSFMLRPPQFDFATSDMNYVALHLDPTRRAIVVRYHGEDGGLIAERAYSV